MNYPDLDPKGTTPGRMPGPHITLISLVVVALFVAALVGYSVGYQSGKQTSRELESFQAVIERIIDEGMIVSGLESNDINHRMIFTLTIDDRTLISWRGEALELSDLEAGDQVSILYRGPVTESLPVGITRVERITKLNDQ